MEDKIFNVVVPTEKKVKSSAASARRLRKKIYQGYVLVDMIVDDNSSGISVRNTPRVTGFVGSGITAGASGKRRD